MASGLYTAIVSMLEKRMKTKADPSIDASPMYPRCFQVLLGGCKGEATDSDRFLAPSYHVSALSSYCNAHFDIINVIYLF